ncbi:Protein DWD HYPERSENSITIVE TO UV-B 1 [Linum grandiflorum]
MDFQPLLDISTAIEASDIEAVDIHNGSSCPLNVEYALALMRAFNQKLRSVDLQDSSNGKDDLFREICRRGIPCQVLNLRSSRIRKLNMVGEFTKMHTLNLDFSTLLTSFQEECFSHMPNLTYLSMCETRVSNLWTTVAALSKLCSLTELRFQKWVCCNDTASTLVSSDGSSDDQLNISNMLTSSRKQLIDNVETSNLVSGPEETFPFNDTRAIQELRSMMEDLSDGSEADFPFHHQEAEYAGLFSNSPLEQNRQANLQNEASTSMLWNQNEEPCTITRYAGDVAFSYISCHASPICSEKHYIEYMIASLPNLKVLDNLPISKTDRQNAAVIYAQSFEYLPYRRKVKESVVSLLHKREIRAIRSCPKINHQKPSSYGSSQYFYTRSLSAAKVGSHAWPSLHPLSVPSCDSADRSRSFRPRQFEYHPTISSLMVFGTLDGEVVVVNHENEKVVGFVPYLGAMNSVLGLSWLKKYPSKLIAGSDNGSLKLYDMEHMPSTATGMYSSARVITFDDFEQLTSVHVNSTDELFLASGYSKNVALYDINYGRRIQVFNDMHREHINVVKFSNHNPSVFATSSFDQDVKLWDLRQKPTSPCYTSSSTKGNVMVCFSPDDHYLLVSAVDNEVRQLLTVDGRLHMNFEIPPTGSAQNYTRSYYMNGRDYIISGSCDEQVVRVCCTQTGRRLRDISLEGESLGSSMYVQSLRGDPFRDFNMSVLAAYMRPSSKSEIVKVSLVASSEKPKEERCSLQSRPSNRMGG